MFLTIGYRAGDGPVARTAAFTSRPRPLANARSIEAIRLVGDVPTGATSSIAIRTCATEADCASAPWQTLTAPIDAQPFFAYRIELTSDGWALPAIDRVELDYRE